MDRREIPEISLFFLTEKEKEFPIFFPFGITFLGLSLLSVCDGSGRLMDGFVN